MGWYGIIQARDQIRSKQVKSECPRALPTRADTFFLSFNAVRGNPRLQVRDSAIRPMTVELPPSQAALRLFRSDARRGAKDAKGALSRAALPPYGAPGDGRYP